MTESNTKAHGNAVGFTGALRRSALQAATPQKRWMIAMFGKFAGKKVSRDRAERAERIKRFLKHRGYHMLGAGHFSTVWGKGADTVIKVNRNYDRWPEVMEWAEQNGFQQWFPRVKALKVFNPGTDDVFYVACMERLYPLSDEEWAEFWDVLDASYGMMYFKRHRKDYSRFQQAKLGAVCDYLEENYPGLIEVMGGLQEKFGYLDLHHRNIMRRADGSIVLSDPVGDYGYSSTFRKRSTGKIFD